MCLFLFIHILILCDTFLELFITPQKEKAPKEFSRGSFVEEGLLFAEFGAS